MKSVNNIRDNLSFFCAKSNVGFIADSLQPEIHTLQLVFSIQFTNLQTQRLFMKDASA